MVSGPHGDCSSGQKAATHERDMASKVWHRSRQRGRGLVVVGVAAPLMLLYLAHPVRAAQESPAPGAYVHDGFYLRFATGFGAYNERAYAASSDAYGGALQARARGFAVASEFAMGGTPWEGLVIGGGIYSTEVYSASLSFSRDDVEPVDLADEARDFTLLSVFVDRYFVPNVGLHVQAALGISFQSALSVDPNLDSEGDDYQAVGPGLMLGLGYEMWIAEQWSLGVLARFGGSVLFGRDSNHVDWVHVITSLPSFLMTVTYH